MQFPSRPYLLTDELQWRLWDAGLWVDVVRLLQSEGVVEVLMVGGKEPDVWNSALQTAQAWLCRFPQTTRIADYKYADDPRVQHLLL
jgi:hypothetical protein